MGTQALICRCRQMHASPAEAPVQIRQQQHKLSRAMPLSADGMARAAHMTDIVLCSGSSCWTDKERSQPPPPSCRTISSLLTSVLICDPCLS